MVTPAPRRNVVQCVPLESQSEQPPQAAPVEPIPQAGLDVAASNLDSVCSAILQEIIWTDLRKARSKRCSWRIETKCWGSVVESGGHGAQPKWHQQSSTWQSQYWSSHESQLTTRQRNVPAMSGEHDKFEDHDCKCALYKKGFRRAAHTNLGPTMSMMTAQTLHEESIALKDFCCRPKRQTVEAMSVGISRSDDACQKTSVKLSGDHDEHNRAETHGTPSGWDSWQTGRQWNETVEQNQDKEKTVPTFISHPWQVTLGWIFSPSKNSSMCCTKPKPISRKHAVERVPVVCLPGRISEEL